MIHGAVTSTDRIGQITLVKSNLRAAKEYAEQQHIVPAPIATMQAHTVAILIWMIDQYEKNGTLQLLVPDFVRNKTIYGFGYDRNGFFTRLFNSDMDANMWFALV